MSSKWAW